MCGVTRSPLGIAYIEFFEEESVAPALKLTGTKIMGIPIQVQHTQVMYYPYYSVTITVLLLQCYYYSVTIVQCNNTQALATVM